MAKSKNREIIKMKSTESAYTYSTTKNKQNSQQRLELRKYDPVVRRHVVCKEAK
jgi:large subunit ribosomal protein L33